MRLNQRVSIFWLFMLGLAPGWQACAPQRGQIRHVIIVSVDGLMPTAYLEPDRYGLRVPTLRKMVREGAYSEGMQVVFPAVTYPTHTSIVTGVNPGRHGIVTNLAWDPLEQNRAGWRWYAEDIKVPTLWQAASARGLRTAMVWWPVSVGATATARVPEYWRASTAEDAKLVRALSTPGLLEEVGKKFPGFNEGFLLPFKDDTILTDIAVHILESVRPHLLLLHIAQVDHWQHENGPMADVALQAIETADQQVARLIAAAQKAGLWPNTVLIVLSDHGFLPTTKQLRPGVWLRQNGLVELSRDGRVVDWKAVVLTSSGSAYIYVKDEADETTKSALLKIFGSAAGQPGSGIARIFRRDEILAMGGDPNAFLALEAQEGFALKGGYSGEPIREIPLRGEHGYPPDRGAMRASLLLFGPPIARGKIEEARAIDVGPTVAAWLGIPFAHAEGKPLQVPRLDPARH